MLIEVEDVNDYVPIFTSALYEGSVYESATVGSTVIQVTALDKDKGENSELLYSIEGGKQLGKADSGVFLCSCTMYTFSLHTKSLYLKNNQIYMRVNI